MRAMYCKRCATELARGAVPTAPMKRAKGASPWALDVCAKIEMLARTRAEFSVNDVWPLIDTQPADPRMMVGVVALVKGRGIAIPTDRVVPNARADAHGYRRPPVRVWRSLVFTATP